MLGDGIWPFEINFDIFFATILRILLLLSEIVESTWAEMELTQILYSKNSLSISLRELARITIELTWIHFGAMYQSQNMSESTL